MPNMQNGGRPDTTRRTAAKASTRGRGRPQGSCLPPHDRQYDGATSPYANGGDGASEAPLASRTRRASARTRPTAQGGCDLRGGARNSTEGSSRKWLGATGLGGNTGRDAPAAALTRDAPWHHGTRGRPDTRATDGRQDAIWSCSHSCWCVDSVGHTAISIKWLSFHCV